MSETFSPQVNAIKEFFQIANDFGEPLEIVREALSNAYDSGASNFSFEVTYDAASGKTIIEMRDNGGGMSYDTLKTNFWDLGNSFSANSVADHIGEKGHGTKIYLRSDRVYVMTRTKEGETSEATCVHPLEALSNNRLHEVEIAPAELDENLLPECVGTYIKVIGYNNSDTSMFTQDRVEDYAYWFTKLGSFECELPNHENPGFSLTLKALDADKPKQLPFGHRFPKENYDIDILYDEFKEEAANNFVKRYVYADEVLQGFPQCRFDVAIYVEGDSAKRSYNKMLRQRSSAERGQYKASDRYGIWLSKDFIPVERKNEWVTSFGTGSNSVVMLHGFINCQQLSLTANRGSVANTKPDLLDALQSRVGEIISEINDDAYRKHGLRDLAELNDAEKISLKEKEEYQTRIDRVRCRKYYKPIKGVSFYEPNNESELYGIFISYYALYSGDFEFEPVDYVTSVGVDVLARSKDAINPADTDFWYVELKKTFSKAKFNHSFQNIRYLLCWDIDKNIKDGDIFESVLQEKRVLHIYDNAEGPIYKLEDPKGVSLTSIQIIQLKKVIESRIASLQSECGAK